MPPPLPAKRGVPLAFAGVGIAAALAIGFFAGRVTAPRGTTPEATPEPIAAMAATPELERGSPAFVETPVIATPIASAPTGAPGATSTPKAIAALATPRTEPRAAATPMATATAKRSLVGTVADALALESAGKGEAATAVLEELVKAEPANAEAHWALASAYRAKKKGPKACPEFRAYVASAPDGENAAEAKRHLDVCRAVTLLDQEKIPEARAAFTEIVRANWTFPDGHYWLGTMQSLNNENAAACTSFKSYLRLDAKGPYVDRATAQLAALGC